MTFAIAGSPVPPGERDRHAAARLLDDAKRHEQRGAVPEAMASCRLAIAAAEADGDQRSLAESLRRLGALCRRRHDLEEATDLFRRSFDVATIIQDDSLAAEAINGLALTHFLRGDWDEAKDCLGRALALGAENTLLRGGIEQNFGVMANAEGDLDAALVHYQRSLEAFEVACEPRGCAIAYHNLGMLNADRQEWQDADRSYSRSLQIANDIGDVPLRGHILLNRTEVHLARQSFEEARRTAEEALRVFEQLGARDLKADAYKFLGVLYRETGKTALAEERLKTAVDIATSAGATLAQAEATRELALLYQQMGRNQETLKLLGTSHRLFGRLNARRDLVDVASKTSQLESIYLKIVREWGASIESSDTYTHGHSERVTGFAVRVARALGLDETELTTIRVGAYLHDLGKVRIPHEILNKAGKLTTDEFEVIKMHPVFGIEMLASVDFPWDIKPIIRSHHEKLDGSGYPDRLRGDEIPLSAQIVGIVDVFDALTSTRSYRGAMSDERAISIVLENPGHYRPEVLNAFLGTVGSASSRGQAA
ncbi:MAG: tetratricopeptide repeat protein [Gemmatimonadota bacterium]|nr:tetratricopeptide repeat protein [Gemmatimonadota bacterium]